MRWVLTIAAVLFGIPLLTFGWLFVTDGKLLIVHNPNAMDVKLTAVAFNDPYIEKTEPRPLAADSFTWIIFRPRVKGGLTLLCTSATGLSTTPLGTVAKPAPMFSNITLNSCDQKVVHRYVPPQRD